MVKMSEVCYFCPNNETKYCPRCDKWLCDNCRKNYPKRILGAFKEKFKF